MIQNGPSHLPHSSVPSVSLNQKVGKLELEPALAGFETGTNTSGFIRGQNGMHCTSSLLSACIPTCTLNSPNTSQRNLKKAE